MGSRFRARRCPHRAATRTGSPAWNPWRCTEVQMRPDHTALKLGNIYWLLAAMAFVIAPHATRLPIWVITLCALVAAWRGFIAWRGLKAPRGWMMVLLAIGATAVTFISEGRIYGRDASTMLLIVMLCLKLLEMRSRRDALLTIFLGFFLVFTNFLYSQTVMMGAYMLVLSLI